MTEHRIDWDEFALRRWAVDEQRSLPDTDIHRRGAAIEALLREVQEQRRTIAELREVAERNAADARHLRIAAQVLEEIKMALRMPGTGSYVDYARDLRDAADKSISRERLVVWLAEAATYWHGRARQAAVEDARVAFSEHSAKARLLEDLAGRAECLDWPRERGAR